MKRKKNIAVTASTGIARLHFNHGLTLHDWSGYGDGHLDVKKLINEMTISSVYTEKTAAIKKCEVLIIDEIGMISATMFCEVEMICRSIRNSNLIFGGIQVIVAGSFLQLPPVPSANDQGSYAFESPVFSTAFPHRINLKTVHRQTDIDLINAINDLCEGMLSERTHKLMQSLKRPINTTEKTVYIFGTNYDVDFFNHMKLQQIESPDVLFTAEDVGEHITFRSSGAHKYLLLKLNCKVVVTRNLYNGLVNGIGGQVIELGKDSVKIRIDDDEHFKHDLSGHIFTIQKYTFTVRDKDNFVIGVRKQLPLKLGYAVTVHKSQGRTLNSAVVDTTNFWRPGQAGVAIGRATSKAAIQVTAYRKSVCQLRHPEVVCNFYSQRSLIMNQNLTCCNKSDAKSHNFLSAGQDDVALIPNSDTEGNICEYLRTLTLERFPFDVNNYVTDLIGKLPKCTQIQIDQVQLLNEFANEVFPRVLMHCLHCCQ